MYSKQLGQTQMTIARSETGSEAGFNHVRRMAWLVTPTVFGIVLGAMALQGAWAQSNLGSLSPSTELQANTGQAIANVCGGLARNPGLRPGGSLQNDLFNRCREMVQNANELNGTQGTDSLGKTTEGELSLTNQQFAAEEAAVAGRAATNTSFAQLSNIAARLAAVRTGTTGLSVSGLNVEGADPTALASMRTSDAYAGKRGGSAGEEGMFGSKRLGVFINGAVTSGDKDATAREDGFDFDTWGITAGVDYRFTDQLVVGAALGYAEMNADLDVTPAVAGGKTNADGWGISGYGTYYWDRAYIDGIVSYGRNSNDLDRDIFYAPGPNAQGTAADGVATIQTASADPDSDQWAIAFGGGYDFNHGKMDYGPYLRVRYLKFDVDSYTESMSNPDPSVKGSGLGLDVDDQEYQSLISALGGRVSTALSQKFGVLIPQARLEWIHEYMNGSEDITARYTNDPFKFNPGNQLVAKTEDPDRDYFALAVGVSAVFRGGVQAFIDYQTWLGLDNISENIFVGGVRFEL